MQRKLSELDRKSTKTKVFEHKLQSRQCVITEEELCVLRAKGCFFASSFVMFTLCWNGTFFHFDFDSFFQLGWTSTVILLLWVRPPIAQRNPMVAPVRLRILMSPFNAETLNRRWNKPFLWMENSETETLEKSGETKSFGIFESGGYISIYSFWELTYLLQR